jgi:chitinase
MLAQSPPSVSALLIDKRVRRPMWAGRLPALVCVALVLAAVVAARPARAATQSPLLAAPYEYLGWGNPQPPAEVLSASGVHDLTLAFILSRARRCEPVWDGARALNGGSDQSAIEDIRAAGGDVVVSFGGWSGRKLGIACTSAKALAAAYQKVIDAYALKAIDIDIEHTEFANATVRKRVAAALASVVTANPGLQISITLPTAVNGPEPAGKSLIADAAAVGLQPTVWTVMPFDFGVPIANMGQVSIEATEGLARDLAAAYHISFAEGLRHSGISSMNGITDERDEVVSLSDLEAMRSFAHANNLARLTFWAVNRDRECGGANTTAEDCSGVAQAPYAYSSVIAGYHG